jgi:hypothetical protein
MDEVYLTRHKGMIRLGLLSFLLLSLLAACGSPNGASVTATPKKTATPTPFGSPETSITPPRAEPHIMPTPIPTPITLPPAPVLGIQGDPRVSFTGIPWVRLSYPTCGSGNLRGNVLKQTIQKYHEQGVHVMLTICQWSSGPALFNPAPLKDAAQSWPDAVQCGNEQMKYDPPATMYIAPDAFARFYDSCKSIMHAVRPSIPIILGSLDPHVGGHDYAPLYDQVGYLNAMQYAMNTSVHSGGNWNWRSEIVGLIDSWHNGYPDQSVNSLYYLFLFWAQQFGVSPSALGQHLWVIEATGCFMGCGIDPYSGYQVAVSHILTLILDVQTAMNYHVPIFYFSGEDFYASGVFWPIGVLDLNLHPKPIRQDLWMGARSLTMSCSNGQFTVVNQLQLLAKLYAGCSLPGDYLSILTS